MPDQRRVLVLLHGLGQSPQAWQSTVGELGLEYSIRAPWVQGLKPTDKQPFDLDRAAHGLASQLELDGVQRASVVGVSVGGMIALRLAAEYPGLVDRLVVAAAQVRPPAAKLQVLAMLAMPRSRFRDIGVDKDRVIDTLRGLSEIDLRDDLAKVRCPTLVAVGSQDKANLPAARVIAGSLHSGRLHLMDGVGAQPNLEDPAAFTAMVRDFVAD